MKKNFVVLILLMIGIVFVSGCAEKECKTDADCLAKTCFTVQCVDNKCVYSPITNCCGNEVCEPGETYENCATDCPNCDDNNECTKDSYDYHEQKCINAPILNVVCCGNSVCETGETYSSCARDCPNCDDDNKCTKDSYDYHEQKCVNELIIPCCGNDICDEDAETYSSCLTDCPNCDDSNKLTTDSFNYATQKCENIVTHYFIDDFEEGTSNWEFPEPTAWSTITENGNMVLRGTGHNWARLQGMEWDNYIFKVKFKVIKGSMHFNYRLNNEGVTTRYMVGVEKDAVSLSKTTRLSESAPPTHPRLGRKKTVQLDKIWHTFEIQGYNNVLNVYINDELLIKYKDTDNPALSGRVAFETLDGAEFLIDDVEIKLITEEDIISP